MEISNIDFQSEFPKVMTSDEDFQKKKRKALEVSINYAVVMYKEVM